MKYLIIEMIFKYLNSVLEKIKENPKNIIVILVSVLIIKSMAQAIYPFGLITTISYIIACIYGFTKIIDDPYRPLVWGVGFIIGTQATNILSNLLIPELKTGTMVSLFSVSIIFYVFIIFYQKSRELKRY